MDSCVGVCQLVGVEAIQLKRGRCHLCVRDIEKKRSEQRHTVYMRVLRAELDCAKVTVLYVTIRTKTNTYYYYACHVLLSLLQLVFVSMIMYIIIEYMKCYDTLLQKVEFDLSDYQTHKHACEAQTKVD